MSSNQLPSTLANWPTANPLKRELGTALDSATRLLSQLRPLRAEGTDSKSKLFAFSSKLLTLQLWGSSRGTAALGSIARSYLEPASGCTVDSRYSTRP